jgi:hypothetical protein
MSEREWSTDEIVLLGRRKYSRKESVPGPLYTPKIPHGQINLTQVKREVRSPVGI